MKRINDFSDNLVDSLGRTISYLRISLTQQCNYCCEYCFSSQNCEQSRPLEDEKMFRLIEAFSLLGIDKIRLTGGEPLLKKNIVNYVKHVSGLDGNKIVGLTTNVSLLGRKLDHLVNPNWIIPNSGDPIGGMQRWMDTVVTVKKA